MGKSDSPVFDSPGPRVKNKIDTRFIPDCFTQTLDEQVMLTCQPTRPFRVRKYNWIRTVFREQYKPFARGVAELHIESDSDLAQYPDSGWMQPFTRQAQ